MTDEMNGEREAAEAWLRARYGAYRGHFAWRELEDAFMAGRASLAANAGSEPVAWTGGEEWESLAWHLCAEENGEESCWELLWEGGPVPEPWGERWMKYEGDAKRMIDLVRKVTHPSPPEGMVAEQALRKVLAAVQRYLPPDGPSAHDTLSEIIGIVDPWPLGSATVPSLAAGGGKEAE
jgi:hypothetical protein